MGQKYCAFISYRHAPLDSKIAREIQQRLERFRVPGAIARRTGRKKLGSVFRDKEELPITSDLNDNINRALENSEYLIVICSPRTRDSIWVQKEIESFLKTHGRNRVLTVLAEGEPGDVIPELLLSDEVTDPETGQTRTVAVEPLSCDYRIPLRAARAEELPRLAATILGCGYDELRQRQRLYRARRLTAILAGVMALSVGMTAYFLWSNRQIRENYNRAEENYQLAQENYKQAQENYRQSMINQSVYLASESQKARRDGDPITAALLAMAALPQSPEDDRPVTPEAELALSQAVGAYTYQNSSVYDMKVKSIFADNVNVKDIRSSTDGHILAAVNNSNILIVWDTQTKKELWRRSLLHLYPRYKWLGRGNRVHVFLTAEGPLLLWDDDAVYGLDLRTGEVQWTVCADAFGDADAFSLALPTPDGDRMLLCASGDKMYCVDAADGAVLWDCAYPEALLDSEHRLGTSCLAAEMDSVFSPDGKIAAFEVRQEEDGEETRCGMLLDLDARTWTFLPGRYREIAAICPLDDETAVILGCGADAEAGIQRYENRGSLATVSRESGAAILWQTELQYYICSEYETVFSHAGTDLRCCIANVFVQLDPATGAVLSRIEAPSPIVECTLKNISSSSASHAVLSDGSIASFNFDTASCSCFPWFEPDVERAVFYADTDRNVPGYYVLNFFSNEIRCYEVDTSWDRDYSVLPQDAEDTEVHSFALDAQRICRWWTGKASSDIRPSIMCLSIPDGELVWQADGLDAYDDIESVLYDTHSLVVQVDHSDDLYSAVDTRTGMMHELPAPEIERYHTLRGVCFQGNTFCRLYLCANETNFEMNTAFLFLVDLDTGETGMKWLDLPAYDFLVSDVDSLSGGFLIHSNHGPEPALIRIDASRGTAEAFDARWLDWTLGGQIRSGDKTNLYFYRENEVALTDETGAEEWTVTAIPYIASAEYDANRSRFLLLGTDGQIYVYSLSGQQIAVLDSGLGTASASSAYEDAYWLLDDPAQSVLFLKNNAYVFDPEVWKLTAIAANCWFVSGDTYFCIRPAERPELGNSSDTVFQDVRYHRYSLDELLEKGRALVGDMKLKDPEKYGLPSDEQ